MQAQTEHFPKHSGLQTRTEAADFLPPPPSGSVRVWQLNLDTLSGFTDPLEAILAPDERKRAHAFATPQLQQRFIGGRGVLRLILGACCAKEPERLVFSYGPYGKPALTGAEAVWKFNLAHSQHMALIAVSRDEEIGVDIEIDRPLPDLAGLMALCFSKQQRNACLAQPKEQQLIEFYRTWTCKEALVKASGEGLQIELPELEIARDGTVLRYPAKFQAYSRYRVYPLPQLKIPAALALGPGLVDWQCEEFPLPALERLFDHDVNRGTPYV